MLHCQLQGSTVYTDRVSETYGEPDPVFKENVFIINCGKTTGQFKNSSKALFWMLVTNTTTLLIVGYSYNLELIWLC